VLVDSGSTVTVGPRARRGTDSGERTRGDSKMSGRIIIEAFAMATRTAIRDRLAGSRR